MFRAVLTVNTDEPEFGMDAGLKLAVARAGTPVTVRFTGPENPGPAATVTVYVVEPPRLIVLDAGVAEIVKSPLTTSVMFAVRARGPLVPRISSGKLPVGVVAPVEMTNDDDPEPVTDAGVNVAVAPDGSPVTVRSTVPVNPETAVTVAVYVAF